jgi:hypothetical protein
LAVDSVSLRDKHVQTCAVHEEARSGIGADRKLAGSALNLIEWDNLDGDNLEGGGGVW